MSRFAKYGWGVLAFNLLVILWGAYVRASGSGAGCGAHWPLCNGTVIPRAPRIETLIELAHRLTSGIALLLVVVQLAWARRALAKGEPARWVAHAAMVLMLTEALVGAGLVLFRMVADNDSIARVYWLAAHLVNTFFLIGALALVPWLAQTGLRPRLADPGRDGKLLFIALAGTLLLGMTGAITALGDTLFPAASLAAGLAQDSDPTSHLLLRLRVFHPSLAVLVVLLILLTAGVTARLRDGELVPRFATLVAALALAQLLAGVVNLLTLAPIRMQLIHLLLADSLWIALVLLTATALATARAPTD